MSGSFDKTRQWDAVTGEPVGEPLRGHSGGVNSVSYSPDGTHIVSGDANGQVMIHGLAPSTKDSHSPPPRSSRSAKVHVAPSGKWDLLWASKSRGMQLATHGVRLEGAEIPDETRTLFTQKGYQHSGSSKACHCVIA